MERRHNNLRDSGLALRRLQETSACSGGETLPCGRVLRCGVIDGCTFEQLRRPASIVNLRMGEEVHIDESLAANKVVFLHVPAENRLEKYDTSDPEVQVWLVDVLRLFEREDVPLPVLVHCRSGKDRTGVVVASLLLILGVPEALIVREFLLSEGAEEAKIRTSLAGIRKAGGPDKYFGPARGDAGLDLELIRRRLTAGEVDAEVSWLRQEVELMCRLAREAAKAHEHSEAEYWRGEVAGSAAELAGRLPPGEAAAALFYRGWALSQSQRIEEAREALLLGTALAKLGNAKPQVSKNLQRQLGTLPEPEGDNLRVLEVASAADDPGDPHARLALLSIDEGLGRWRVLQCPPAFAWLRCGELAASTTPQARHLRALDAMGLTKRVCAEVLGAPRSPEEHLEEVVSQIADALASGNGCLVHCSSGFGVSGTALACFLILFGLDDPVKAGKPGQPKMTGGEAVEVLRALRSGCLASPEEEAQVHSFAQAAWARHIERAQRAFCGSAAAAGPSQRTAPSSARVVRQPGDGNCLFHSLAYGLGSGTAASVRAEICAFMEQSPGLSIAGTSLAEWIQMLAGCPVSQYARKMAKSAQWGGAPEIAACAHMRKVNIHVYERRGSGFELTVPFDVGGTRTVRVLYVGGVHYDALIL